MIQDLRSRSIAAEYKKGNYDLPVPYAAEQNRKLIQDFVGWGSYNLHINSVSLFNVLEKVRNLILNWTIELVKKDIIGEDMNFTEDERGVAPKISPIYNKTTINGNVGVMGNVSDSTNMRISLSQTQKINIDQAKDFLEQAMQGLQELPDEIVNKLEPLLNELTSHLMISNPTDSQMRNLFTSIRAELVVASGTVIGQALIAAIRTLIGN